MGMNWTEEQQKVIDVRDRNILVSAAAGSGKTAVLVERIIKRLTGKNPIDVDRLLIVTFTGAAAAEMKERIRIAIEKELEKNPDNLHLQRQATLIHNALITTIHSFCLSVIREHFHVIDLDPGFRICEEGELKLLSKDIVEELLEERYSEGNDEFLNFVERFANGRDDKKLEELIIQWYEYSRSYPQPERWIMDCAGEYQEAADGGEPSCMKQAVRMLNQYLDDARDQILIGLEICKKPDGPYMYSSMLESDLIVVEDMRSAKNFTQMFEAAQQVAWKRLSPKKDIEVSEEKKDAVKTIRENVKNIIKDLKTRYFHVPPDEIMDDMKNASVSVKALTDLVIRYGQMYAQRKMQNGMIDFSDMEQFALQILTESKEDKLIPSMIAREYQEQFVEVMIDEYQDSNLIQEAILTSVSTVSRGKNNIFMVGDVKQSIYSFRLSRPELFMEKFQSYTLEDSEAQRIDLHKNFRSRAEVLDSINFIFYQIMGRDLGGIEYDDGAALYVGADYEPVVDKNGRSGNRTEVILVDTTPEKIYDGDREAGTRKIPARETESRAIAQRIKELMRTQRVKDKETGEYRRASYKDIVILTRSVKGWREEFAEVLNREGIPTYAGKSEGYFETYEVSILLDYLSILDNVRQDLPLTAVLTSPLVGLNAEQLAVIRTAFPEVPFHEAVSAFVEMEQSEEWGARLRKSMKQIESYRSKVSYTAIHELLWHIIEDTGYGDVILAMPGGEQRKANVDMLVEKAVAFEGTSYKGLFNFVRYIEQLKKYDIDYGEASLTDDRADVVRLMSIHKSKGLEFPIVFVAGMGKRFNLRDLSDTLVIHSKWGVGVDAIDLEKRTKAPTLLRKVIQEHLLLETLGEELRILYVALTRAKEKLIMIGTVNQAEEKLQKVETAEGVEPAEAQELPGTSETTKAEITFTSLTQARTYFDWVLQALEGRPHEVPIDCRVVTIDDLELKSLVQAGADTIAKDVLLNWDDQQIFDSGLKDRLDEQLNFLYPYKDEGQLKLKFTVSELKKRVSIREQSVDEIGEELYTEPAAIPLLPKFLQADTELKGASRGTAYHKVLELLDFAKEYNEASLIEIIRVFTLEEKMSEEMADCIRISDILAFLQCPVGRRMHEAAKRKNLYAEQPFVLGVDAEEVYPGSNSDETILVQGIIDVFFEEDGELVVLDYKTDRIHAAHELLEKYHAQLDYYAKALERMTGRKVKEKIIYSFTLQQEIALA